MYCIYNLSQCPQFPLSLITSANMLTGEGKWGAKKQKDIIPLYFLNKLNEAA
jgi:hypothetical protein